MKETPAMWFVYLIECRSGALYCGVTNNLQRRYQAHINGSGARFTKMDPPARLAYAEGCDDKSSALKREIEIKRMSRAEKLTLTRKSPAPDRSGAASDGFPSP